MANGRFAEGYLLLEEITQAIFRTKVDLSGRRIHDLEHALESACAALKEHSKDSEHVTPAEVIAAWKRLARGE